MRRRYSALFIIILVTIAFLAPLSRQGLGTRIEGLWRHRIFQSLMRGFPVFMYAAVMSLHILYGIVNGGRRAKIRGIFVDFVSIYRTFPSVLDRKRCDKEHCSFKARHFNCFTDRFWQVIKFFSCCLSFLTQGLEQVNRLSLFRL